jgi:hypothetical protein
MRGSWRRRRGERLATALMRDRWQWKTKYGKIACACATLSRGAQTCLMITSQPCAPHPWSPNGHLSTSSPCLPPVAAPPSHPTPSLPHRHITRHPHPPHPPSRASRPPLRPLPPPHAWEEEEEDEGCWLWFGRGRAAPLERDRAARGQGRAAR